MRISKHHNIYWITFAIWLIAVFIKFKFNGLILNFDYGLYHPDGTLYTTKTLDWGGLTEVQSANRVSDWYNNHSYKLNRTKPEDFYYDINPFYKEYSTRVLYPLLSIPWVYLFGIPGMLVVPAISLLILLQSIAKIGTSLNKPFITLVSIFLISSSTTVTRWMFANTTDALLVAIFAIVALFLTNHTISKNHYLIIALLILFSSFTRFCFLFWLGIAVIQLSQKHYRQAVYITFISGIAVLPTILSHNSSSFLAVEGERQTSEKILLLPFYFIKIIFYETIQLLILDRILFILCAVSIYLAMKNLRKLSSKYLLIFLAAGLLTGTLNGTVGVNFRYQLPILVFIGWSLIDNSNFSFERFLKASRYK